ncbi:MAG: gamma-glutamyl-gamma-aminobutyrate hydrolase family protein [Alphaproteobacteria bacterium]|nr:gamma-glutamyl-gamma-aminobutyrate hydrolase family protein [Alphaproteobacteria bacterium]
MKTDKPIIALPYAVGNMEIYADAISNAGGALLYVGRDMALSETCIRPHGVLLPGAEVGAKAEDYISAIEWTEKNEVSLLAICFGMQALARYLGGKIVDVSGHGAGHHRVNLVPGTIVSGIGSVNSLHEKAVDIGAGGDFFATAHAGDGAIEAIEPKKPWNSFVLGVQWRPQLLAAKILAQQKIFDDFVKAAAGQR